MWWLLMAGNSLKNLGVPTGQCTNATTYYMLLHIGLRLWWWLEAGEGHNAKGPGSVTGHGTHSASSHWLTEQCGEKAPKLALPVARTVQTGSAPH